MKKLPPAALEVGKRVSTIRHRLEIDGKSGFCQSYFQEIIKDLGLSWEIIRQLQESVGLPQKYRFPTTITSENSELLSTV